MKLYVELVNCPLKAPFVITGHTFVETKTVRVILKDAGVTGRGEGVGIYYMNDDIDAMYDHLMSVREEIEKNCNADIIQKILPAGGARNALDCAYWDFLAKKQGKSIWQLLNIQPKPLTTVCTVGIGSKDYMAKKAQEYSDYPNLKIKLDNDIPIEKLEEIRNARPDARLIIDVNQGWTFEELKDYAPHCEKLGIAMIEQPLPRGGDDMLAGYKSPVPLGADESCLDASEYDYAAQRYDVINIKLDKCGGLTAGLEIVKRAQDDQKRLMIGNMTGTSLSMAPAYVIGQYCDFVDIDGPLLFTQDIVSGLEYQDGGVVSLPDPALWG